MKVAIVGYGKQGHSSFEYWQKEGHDLTICDMNESISVPDGAKAKLGINYLHDLDQFDLIVRSPATHPLDIQKANPEALDILNKVTSNTNEFMGVCPTKNFIGVTGTKGKGTTSSLIAHMLTYAGKKVHLGGNIGIPPLEMLKNDIQPDDWVVLELANFQLIDARHSPKIAVCLLMADEHLDWHASKNEYIEAKQQLFRWQTEQDIAIYFAHNALSQQIASVSRGQHIPYFSAPGARVENNLVIIDDTAICSTEDIKLPGQHNWQNVCAAVTAVWQVTQDVDAIRSAIQNFGGLPYRIEKRATINDVAFYNDSFSTNPSSARAAIEAITQPKIMIMGGFDRGLDLTELAEILNTPEHHIKHIEVIGAAANRLADALRQAGVNNFSVNPSRDMTQIVRDAYAHASPGDAVVLSPAFASFDMFKNFEVRGNEFNAAVETLA